ncbi:MAG TPA: AraC family transcriptional regulator [Candidatus Limnocylindria bacterium]|nr:AraC family transcriptional regulator [Candidatus Limnocylindria bacterium]
MVTRPGLPADGYTDRKSQFPKSGVRMIAGAPFVVYVARGEGWFRSPNVTGPLDPGTLICAPPGPFHCDMSADGSAVVVGLAERATDDWQHFTLPFVRQLSPTDGEAWDKRLTGILDLVRDEAVRADDVDALRVDLAPLVWRKRAPYAQETLETLFCALRDRREEQLSLETLAGEIGYAANYLPEFVRTHTGRSLGKWIADIRMTRARHDLEFTETPIAQIGTACGYDDPAYFSRAFRRIHGVPPAHWRLAKRSSDGGDSRFTISINDLKRERASLSRVPVLSGSGTAA